MIILPDHKAVFVSVPECGTHSIYQALKGHYGGVKIGAGYHPNMLPGQYRSWFAFTCVRNPYDRAVSLWWSTCKRVDKQGDRYGFRARTDDPDSFESFMHMLLRDRPCVAFLGPSICHHLRWIDVDLRVLKLETLDRDFAQLPFFNGRPEQWGRKNPTVHDRGHWSEYVTDYAAELVRRWAGRDFERFGYAAELPAREGAPA